MKRNRLHSFLLTGLLLLMSLHMMAAELGEAGKRLAALAGVSHVETLKSSCFPEKYVFYIQQQLDAKAM